MPRPFSLQRSVIMAFWHACHQTASLHSNHVGRGRSWTSWRSYTIVDHTMWTVVVRCQVDTVSVTGIKTSAMLWTEFPSSDTNMVNFHIEYVYNFKTSV